MNANIKAIKPSKGSLQPITHKIADIDLMSVVYWFSAFKRVASASGLHRNELEVLSAVHGWCQHNEKRLGQALTCAPEILTTCVSRHSLNALTALNSLLSLGLITRHPPCSLWKKNPYAYSVTVSGLKVLAQIPLELKEQQIRLSQGYNPRKKRTAGK